MNLEVDSKDEVMLWLNLQPVEIKSRWRDNWKLAQVVNSHLVCDPTIQQPGFDFPRQQPFLHETGTLRCLQKEISNEQMSDLNTKLSEQVFSSNWLHWYSLNIIEVSHKTNPCAQRQIQG